MNSKSVLRHISSIYSFRANIFFLLQLLIFYNSVLQAQYIQTVGSNSRSVFNQIEETRFNDRQRNNSKSFLEEHLWNKKFKDIRKDQLTKGNSKLRIQGSLIFKPNKIIYDSTNRQTFTYDQSGNCLTENIDTLFVEYGVWLNSQKITNTYDSAGNRLTELHEQYYPQTDIWEATFRYTYAYDQYNNLSFSLCEIWRWGKWENYYRFIYTYDSSNNLLFKLEEDWLYNGWVSYSRQTFTYDNSDNQLVELIEICKDNVWRNDNRTTNTYDLSGNCLTELWEIWSVNNTKWFNYFLDFYTYDSLGNYLTDLNQTWSNNAWEDMNKDTYSYDNLNNKYTILNEAKINNVWTVGQKQVYTYDNNRNSTCAESYWWRNESWIPAASHVKIYFNHNQEYLLFYAAVVTVEYSSYTDVANENISGLSFILKQNYPNPFNPSTTISYSLPSASNIKLIVYNTLGQRIKTLVSEYKTAGSYTMNFNASALPSGIYFYKLEAGQTYQIKKMMLIK
jgi:hypothetical protein